MRRSSRQPIREIRRRIFSRCYLDLSGAPGRSILLAGAGRSGTTWLAEQLSDRTSTRVMFEPFHRRAYRKVGLETGFDWYIPPGQAGTRLRHYADRVLSGRVRSAWIDGHNRRFFCRRRLIKDVSCLPGLTELLNRAPEMPCLLLLRSPFAVAKSRMKLGWGTWHDCLLRDSAALDAGLREVLPLVNSLESDFEKHVAQWCLEYYFPIHTLPQHRVTVVCYEHLKNAPVRINDLRRALKWPEHPYVQQSAVRRSVTSAGSNVFAGKSAVVSKAEELRALELLAAFGLNYLYPGGTEPGFTPDEIIQTGAGL